MSLYRIQQIRTIFVFGSNEAGRHGAGSAKLARELYGAITGQGVGLQGDSYAIPTKNRALQKLSLPEINLHVERFLAFAHAHQEMNFVVVKIGCGLAGYADSDIAPMFAQAPANCILPGDWRTRNGESYLGDAR